MVQRFLVCVCVCVGPLRDDGEEQKLFTVMPNLHRRELKGSKAVFPIVANVSISITPQ